jgi:hypothetical protein
MISFRPAVSTAPVSSDSAYEKVCFHRIPALPAGNGSLDNRYGIWDKKARP